MSHDDDVEWAKFLRDLIWARHQAVTIESMEGRLGSTPPQDEVPMPNACHPALSHQADFVRNFHNPGHVLQIYGMPRQAMSTYTKGESESYPSSEEITPNRLFLTRRKVVGLAPFVGDPRLEDARYLWYAWVDHYGRYICTDSELVFMRRF